MLKYYLAENFLTEKTDYVAQVLSPGSYNKEAIIEEMLKRGSLLTRTDILAVLNELENVVSDLIASGHQVNTPLFNTSFSIAGVFDSPIDSFDTNRHRLKVNVNKGSKLRSAEGKVTLEKTNVGSAATQILEVKDSLSGSINSILSSGGIIELYGQNIKIEGSISECGLYFVSADGNRTKSSTLAHNKPGMIIASIPILEPGEYSLEILTQYSHSAILKNIRIVTFNKSFTVSH